MPQDENTTYSVTGQKRNVTMRDDDFWNRNFHHYPMRDRDFWDDQAQAIEAMARGSITWLMP